jgi:hypothetical protein
MLFETVVQFIRIIAACGIGLFGTGYFLARFFRSKSPTLLAFPLSLLILFHCVFLVGLSDWGITFIHVLIPLFSVLAVLICSVPPRRGRLSDHAEKKSTPNEQFPSIIPKLICSISLLLLIQQSLLTPLSGYDTFFRWDYLAQRILELHNFNFYPPIHPSDFKNYYFVDGFPPIVSFAYWWTYAAFGRYMPQLSALVVVPQYIVVLCLTFSIARRLAAPTSAPAAGWLAVAILACSSAYFRDQAIGQESGLMAVSLLSMLWVLLCESANARAMILAGACAAIGAMCREYGWAYVLFGLLIIVGRYRSLKLAAIFFTASLIFAGPWYLRNFILTGNPFFSLKFLGLPINTVFAGMMESYRPHFGVGAWDATRWKNILVYLLVGSPMQLTLGVVGMIALLRRSPWLAIAVVMSFALWLYSAGYTNGGEEYSSRTLAPAWAILSICAAIWSAKYFAGRRHGTLYIFTAICFAAALVSAWIFPFSFFNRPTESWLKVGLHSHPRQDPVEAMVPQIEQTLPRSCRILGDGLVMHVLLRQAGYELVPPWSPEVKFLFDANISPEQAIARLRALQICAVLAVPGGTNTFYFVEHSPFYRDAARWERIGSAPGVILFRLPDAKPQAVHAGSRSTSQFNSAPTDSNSVRNFPNATPAGTVKRISVKKIAPPSNAADS